MTALNTNDMIGQLVTGSFGAYIILAPYNGNGVTVTDDNGAPQTLQLFRIHSECGSPIGYYWIERNEFGIYDF